MSENNGNRYVIDDPKLMAEWDWDKNAASGLSPSEITYGSAKKVFWKCSQNHSWLASPNHRSRGRNCPECAKEIRANSHHLTRLATQGSLAELNPALAAQWHPTKNGTLTPSDVTIRNGRKVWWLCEQGHEWKAVIGSRSSGVNCPICSNHQILVGYNDFATTNPQLAAQWHPTKNGGLTPHDITANNQQKVWWICERGHEWEAKVANRNHGCNCPICSGKQVLVGYNDLATTNPDIASQWHPQKNGTLTPQNIVANSNKKVWWICEKGHEWNTSVAHRSRGRQCPECSAESKTSFPEQAIFFYLSQLTPAANRYMVNPRTEIDIFLPEQQIGIEYDGIFYHSSTQSQHREQRKEAALVGAGITLIRVKESDTIPIETTATHTLYCTPGPSDQALTRTIQQLLALLNQLTGDSLKANIDISRDRSLIYEQYVKSQKVHSLLSINPQLAAQWHPEKNGKLSPEYVTASSNKKVWWLCNQGHEWQAIINSRNKGVGCPFCSKRKRLDISFGGD